MLAVDIGNTQSSFGVFEQSKLRYHWRGQTKGRGTSDEWASFFLPLLEHHRIQRTDFEAIALCSVVPTVDWAFETFCLDYFHIRPFWVHPGIKLSYRLGVDTPQEVGADRLANTEYAVCRMELPAVVIDMGTATTFDVVSREKVYGGGIILPGVTMGIEALGTQTSKLPLVELSFPKQVIGRNTIDCIRSGILYGYCDLIDGLIDRVNAEIGRPVSLALTGGVASLFHDRLRHKTQLIPDLTLEGIRLLHQENT